MTEFLQKIVGCCIKPTKWVFVYKNNDIYSICKDHFYSISHRWEVHEIINFKTCIRYEPEEIFKRFPIIFDKS